MSHFTVMVVGDDYDHQLAPFHEYECTGRDDEFVVSVDMLAEATETYKTATAILVIKRPDGSKFYAFKNGKYTDELLPFVHDRELKLPEGWAKLHDEPASSHQTIVEWAADYYGWPIIGSHDPAGKYGHIRLDPIEMIRRTNPNAQWDWYVLGGRWSNKLLLKDGTRVDQARKVDIDAAKMRADNAAALSTYAYLANREWFSRGKMGWFGMSDDEMPQEEWHTWINARFDALPDDAIISVVDCHI